VDECHRSHVFAYPVLLSAMPGIPQLTDHSFVACSGAAIQALFDTNNSNRFEVMNNGGAISGQLYAAAFGQPVSLVTLTIGGNDLDFPGILDTCVKAQLPPSCFVKVHSSISTLLPKIDGRQTAGKYTLAGVYLEARKQAPSARILVLGYPHEFNPDLADQFYIGPLPVPATGRLHLSKDDETVMNSATDAMDAVIRANVELANSAGARIEYVADSVSKFVTHEQDTKPSMDAFNGISATGIEKSFHPNSIGQGIYAKAVYDYLQGHPAAPARPKDRGKDLPPSSTAGSHAPVPTGTNSPTTPPLSSTTPSAPPTGCSGVTYFDARPGDQCSSSGGTLNQGNQGGWTITVGALTPSLDDTGRPQLCSQVAAIKRGSEVGLMVGIFWSIETDPPGSAAPTTAGTIGGTMQQNGYIQPGGTAQGTFCFADVGHPGQILVVFSAPGGDRSLWISNR